MASPKVALVTGVSGQDGAYLAKLLLGKGYRVIGSYRSANADHFWRLDKLAIRDAIELVAVDPLDEDAVKALVAKLRPDEIYNLASFSSVVLSFQQPVAAAQANITALLHLLEAVRSLSLQTRIFQASSSEVFGNTDGTVDETSPFSPQSPYAIAKASAHRFGRFYREGYGVHTNIGILFNHESPLRDPSYFSMKVATGLAAIREQNAGPIIVGNLDIVRDWGFAGDYVEGMWACNQLDNGEDFVFASGQSHSARNLVESACRHLGFDVEWQGAGLENRGIDRQSGRVLVAVSKEFYRPFDAGRPIGNSAKAQRMLGWKPRVSFNELIGILVQEARGRLAHR